MGTRFGVRYIARAAIVAAVYAALTILLAPISYGMMQVRVSEALTLLPVLTPAAIPGLFIGCLIANVAMSGSPLDMIIGPLATLVAAFMTRALRDKPTLAAAPPVFVNAFAIAGVLNIAFGFPYFESAAWIALGQSIACWGLGLTLLWALKRTPRGFISD